MPVDAEQEKPGRDKRDFGAIDVAALMEQVRLEAPRGTVTVKGIVDATRPSKLRPTVIYGDLRGYDQQSIMSFQCPVKGAPQPKEHVIFRGTLTARKSTWHRGFELELVGERIGEWAPGEPAIVHAANLERKLKLKLERFVSENAVKRLVLIGTRTGIGDAETTLSRGFKQPFEAKVTTTGLDSLLAAIVETAPKYDGLCLVRGGGDPDSFATWHDLRLIAALIDCGKPFYTALGHSTDMTLADKYADESFATPSALGSACKDAWKAREEREDLERELETLRRTNRNLKAANDGAERAGRDKTLATLQNAITELRQLPATLGILVSQSMSTAVRASIQDDFSRPFYAAAQGPITDLKQATYQAQAVMTKVARQSRWHSRTWMLSVFLAGIIVGTVSCFFALSQLPSMRQQPGTVQQQTAPPPVAAPAQGAVRKKPQSLGQAN